MRDLLALQSWRRTHAFLRDRHNDPRGLGPKTSRRFPEDETVSAKMGSPKVRDSRRTIVPCNPAHRGIGCGSKHSTNSPPKIRILFTMAKFDKSFNSIGSANYSRPQR